MSFNAKDMTQGGQIASMRIRMFSQIANMGSPQNSEKIVR
ncbi:conjugal transfer protein TraD [Escherichia coli]|nr:conjugal transfer protein TraD [Escherichia coli]